MSQQKWMPHPKREYCLNKTGVPSWFDGDPMLPFPQVEIPWEMKKAYYDCRDSKTHLDEHIKTNFKAVRDSVGNVKAFITFNESYIGDIRYALNNLGIKYGKSVGNSMPITFPYQKFNELKKIVGINYIEIEEPVNILPIESPRGKFNESKKNKTKNIMEKYMNIKTIAGVGIGVAIGHLAVKSSNPLVLIAFGIGGGILANMIKTQAEKEEEKESKLLEKVSQEIEEAMSDESSDMSGVSFNPTVGYFTRMGTVEETSPSNYMDVTF